MAYPHIWNAQPVNLEGIDVDINGQKYKTYPNVLMKNRILQTPFGSVIEQTPEFVNTFPNFNGSSGLENNYFAQKDMTKYLLYRILDYWLYDDRLCNVLKYLKVTGNTVSVLKTKKDVVENSVCSEPTEIIQLKSDYIHENFLNLDKMKHILKKIISDTGLKWFQLADHQKIVVSYVEHYLKKILKNNIPFDEKSIDEIKKNDESESKLDAEYMQKLKELRELEKRRKNK